MLVMLTCKVFAPQAAQGGDGKTKIMITNAEDYIASFQRGEDFVPPAVAVIVHGQPDPAALRVLGQQLAIKDAPVREKIVALLVDMGRRTDPLTAKGADVLRNPQILAVLAGAGLVKPDLGREAAMDALRKLVTPSDLTRFGVAFTKALEEAPTEEAFLLVAKAKPPEAIPLVERLAETRRWKDVEAAKIARGALGKKEIEEKFLAAMAAAQNGTALARALSPLGLMGTPRSLKAIAERLRTPWTINVPGAYEKSVRLNVLEALLYNFPDQPVLYPNNIIKDSDYIAAELFCTATLGVVYTSPRPAFLTYRGYPLPLPK